MEKIKKFTELLSDANTKNAEDGSRFRFTWEYIYPTVNGGQIGFGIKANVYDVELLEHGCFDSIDKLTVAVEVDCHNYKTDLLEEKLNDLATDTVKTMWGPGSNKQYFL